MVRKLLVALVLAAALLAAGCFDYQEYVVLKKDGSGTLDMRIGMQSAMLDGLLGMAQAFGNQDEPAEEDEAFISKAGIEKYLAENDAGVKMLSYEEADEGELHVWKIKYSFNDLSSIHHITESLNDDFDAMEDMAGNGEPEEEDADMQPELSFTQQEDGTWLFERGMETDGQMPGMGMGDEESWEDDAEAAESEDNEPAQAADEEAEGGDGADEMTQAVDQMTAAMGKYGIKLTVEFPGEVIESNATTVDGNKATWAFKLNEMGKFPSKLRAVIK